MPRKTVILANDLARRTAMQYLAESPLGYHVTFKPPTRNLDQNAKMWVLLGEISKQVEWYGRRLAPEDWKHVFAASLKRLDVVPNLDGTGFVALGTHTSTMTIREMSDLIELATAFAVEKGVEMREVMPA